MGKQSEDTHEKACLRLIVRWIGTLHIHVKHYKIHIIGYLGENWTLMTSTMMARMTMTMGTMMMMISTISPLDILL